jgi:hypothetical protein
VSAKFNEEDTVVARTILGVVMVVASSAAAHAHAAGSYRVIGVVTAVSDRALEIVVRGATTVKTDGRSPSTVIITPNRPWAVSIDDGTKYIQLSKQTGQQDMSGSRESLVVGRCVDVQLGSRAGVADLIRVSAEPARSPFDPCKSVR